MKKIIYLFIFLAVSVILKGQDQLYTDLADQITFVVAQDGSGDYTTIQEAINAVPSGSSDRSIIYVKNGIYEENKLYVSSTKLNLTILGENVDSTIITHSPTHASPGFGSASLKIAAKNFTAYNLTIENSFGAGSQAEALATSTDAQQFAHCKFVGYQDTYYSGSSYRNYFKDCLIIGAVDYVFGNATVLFDSCQVHNVRSRSWITAASTAKSSRFGYVFKNCMVTGNYGVKDVYFGRPWKDYPKVLFMECYLSDCVNPVGWHNTWHPDMSTVDFMEYNNYGPGSDVSNRIDYSRQLSEEEASAYVLDTIFGTNNSLLIKTAWKPLVVDDPVFAAVQKYYPPFMNEEVTQVGMSSITINGEPLAGFNSETEEYTVDLPAGSTEWPILEGIPADHSMKTQVVYPDTIPGVATVVVSSKYEAMHKSYKVQLNSDQQFVYMPKKVATIMSIGQNITQCIPIKSEEISERGLRIYPNPSDGLLRINIQDFDSNEPLVVNVYSLKGQLVYSEVLDAKSIQSSHLIDLTNFPSGNYLLNICASSEEYSANIILK